MTRESEDLVSELRVARDGARVRHGDRLTGVLLGCGMLSAVVYTAMLAFVPLGWPSYDSASWTVSELSAIDAPTRSVWVAWSRVWTLLYVAFGVGVWRSARFSRALRAAGSTILIAGIFGAFWPPMHQRAVLAAGGGSLTDTLHIVWTAVNGILTLLAMAFGAAALAGSFRRYTFATMLTLVAAGALTALEAPGVDANLPTPSIGVWERINIGAWLLWVAVLAAKLLGGKTPQARTGSEAARPMAACRPAGASIERSRSAGTAAS
jgi:hypothetical protein